jgi:diguanylate cyclase (GGDEF)-like protein
MKFNFTEALQARSDFFRAFFGAALMATITLLDYFTRAEIAFAVFYLLPISYFSWFFRPLEAGFVAAVVSACVWLVLAIAKPHTADPYMIYVNGLINLGLFLGAVFLLGEVKSLYLRERQRSRSDFLTGLANRRAFHETLSLERDRALRHKFPITAAYIDIDNFKRINDTFDHETGDKLLATIAAELQRNVRRIDLVARLGGDEFAILLPQTSEESARSVLGKLGELLRGAMQRGGWNVTFSIGVVTFLNPQLPIEQMVRLTDELMYSVKSSGKGRIAYSVKR